MKKHIVSLFVIACLAGSASAATYQVGPGRPFINLQTVAPLLNPGDVVEVDGSVTYPGGVIFTRPGAPDNKITVRGNVFQHIATQGTRMARVGGDGTGYTNGRYRFVNNTFILRQGQTSPAIEIFQGIESLEAHNNVFFRPGGEPIDKVVLETGVSWVSGRVSAGSSNWLPAGSARIPEDWTGTLFGTNPGFVNSAPNRVRLAAAYDLRPTANSPLINAGNAVPASPAGHPFINPLHPPAYHPPLPAVGMASLRRPSNGVIDIGAYEYAPRTYPIR